MSGPGVCKAPEQNSIQAILKYRFYFKWGGCTTDIQNITDPGDQPHFPVPNNFLQGPEIQDPSEDPKNEVWDFDMRRQILTKSASERIKQDFSTSKIIITGSKLSAEPKSKETSPWSETPTPEEEEKTPEQQLQLLRDHQHQLRQQLRHLLKKTPAFKYSDL